MQADDLINLVSHSGRRRGGGGLMSSKFLRPMLRSFVPRFLSAATSSDGDTTGEAQTAEEVREEPDNESTTEEDGLWAKICAAKMHILFFVFIFAVTLNWTGAGFVVGQKSCLKYNTTEEFCKRWQVNTTTLSSSSPSIEHHPQQQQQQQHEEKNSSSARIEVSLQKRHKKKKHADEAEQAAQLYLFYQGLVAFVPPSILVLVLASCCDEFSSFRLPFAVSIIGSIVTASLNLVSSFYPRAPLFYDVLTPLAEMLCGGLPLALMCVYVYVAATVPVSRRTTAFFLLQVCFMLAFALARLVSSLAVEQWNGKILGIFVTAIVMLIISLVYTSFAAERIDLSEKAAATADENQRQQRRRQRHRRNHGGAGGTNQDPVLLSTRLFSHHHLFSSVRGLVQERVRGSRYELLFLVVVIFFLVATTRSSVSSFFLDADPSNAVLDSVIIIVTLLLVMPVFVLIVKSIPMDPNYTITIIGLLFLTASQSLQFATNNPALNHVRQVLHTISNIAPAGIRAHVATLVERKDLGKAYGIVAACESIAPLIGSAIRKLIGHGLGQLPFLLITGGFVAFLAIGHCKQRRSLNNEDDAEEASAA